MRVDVKSKWLSKERMICDHLHKKIKRNVYTYTHMYITYNYVHNLPQNNEKGTRNFCFPHIFFRVFILFLIMCMTVFQWVGMCI